MGVSQSDNFEYETMKKAAPLPEPRSHDKTWIIKKMELMENHNYLCPERT